MHKKLQTVTVTMQFLFIQSIVLLKYLAPYFSWLLNFIKQEKNIELSMKNTCIFATYLTLDSQTSRTDLSNLGYISESAVGALSNAATTNWSSYLPSRTIEDNLINMNKYECCEPVCIFWYQKIRLSRLQTKGRLIEYTRVSNNFTYERYIRSHTYQNQEAMA